MIYVTTPMGHKREYPNANYINWKTDPVTIKTSRDGRKVAYIPVGWMISFDNPVNSSVGIEMTFDVALMIVSGSIESLSKWSHRHQCKQLKTKLRLLFNAKTLTWKNQ